MTSRQVALALIEGLKQEREEICVGWQSYLALWLQRFAPWLLELIILMTAPLPKRRSRFT